MPAIFHNPSKCNRKTIKNIQVKLKSRFAQKWQQEVSMVKLDKSKNEDTNKLRTYKTFKRNFEQEKYVLLNNPEQRKVLSQFRISAHRLEIEVSRYTIPKNPVSSRTCKQCNHNLVENELHILVECPKYTNFRNTLYSKINNKNFGQLSNISKFNWLMSIEDLHVIREVAV